MYYFVVVNCINILELYIHMNVQSYKLFRRLHVRMFITFGCSYMEKVPNIVMFIMSIVSCVSTYFDILLCKYNLNIVRKLPN